jgi:DNA-binding IclR family transcriptional regulator
MRSTDLLDAPSGPIHPAEINYTAQRVLRALEVIVFRPSTAPVVAEAIGVNARTARRILGTLAHERYVERGHGRGRAAHAYTPTVRLLALAGQLAARIPIVDHGRRATAELHRDTRLGAYAAVPSYAHALVVARAGEHSPQLWTLRPAHDDAAGRLLLAYRHAWRHSGESSAEGERAAAAIRAQGRVVVCDDTAVSVAVPVPSDEPPIAALALHGRIRDVGAATHSLVAAAHRLASAVARSRLAT